MNPVQHSAALISLIFTTGAFAVAIPPDSNPKTWVCEDTAIPVTQIEIEQWCSNRPTLDPSTLFSRGIAPTLSNLPAKNNYDVALGDWLKSGKYQSWAHDETWRLTGPIVGDLINGKKISKNTKSYGSHPAVRVYYSPQVVDWLCSGRKGDIGDGAMIIKQQISLSAVDLAIDHVKPLQNRPEEITGCLSIPTAPDFKFNGFAVIVRAHKQSRDGWYWWTYGGPSNPPIIGKSAFTADPKQTLAGENADKPNPKWYPTSTSGSYTDPVTHKQHNIDSNNVTAYNMYGAACLNCHGSAEKQSTFASLDNIIGGKHPIQFKFYGSLKEKDDAVKIIHPESAGNHMTKTKISSQQKIQTLKPKSGQQRPAPFPTPLAAPNKNFVEFYKSVSDTTEDIWGSDFYDVWKTRLPAQTFDHVVAGVDGPDQFLTSDQCQGCHDATLSNSGVPNMIFTEKDGTQVNLSPYATWRVSPMGLAGRDPIFFAQLQSETNNLPELTECIENTCLHCHGAMGQRMQAIDTQAEFKTKYPDTFDAETCRNIFPVTPSDDVPFGKPFALDQVTDYQDGNGVHAKYGALARDGISCTVCHNMSDQDLGTEAVSTGNFISAAAGDIYGPYKNDTIVTKPMQHVLGVKPQFGDQITDSALCASCHNILLPVFKNNGAKAVGASYEQTTGLEWQNSIFALRSTSTFKSCADCHMQTDYKHQQLQYEIANIQSSNEFAPTTHALPDEEIKTTTRKHFARHTLVGLNIFLNEMFQEFPVLLGLAQIDYMNGNTKPQLTHARESFLDFAQNQTATIAIDGIVKTADSISSDITVTNLAGHFLPSGVGFRRVLLEYRIVDKSGKTLWCSGCTNDLGVVIDDKNMPIAGELTIKNPKSYQPHYQTIDSQKQAQIYQELITDSDGNFTTSFLRRIKKVKDNRIRPKGYNPEFYDNQFESKYIKALSETHGKAKDDPYYTDPRKTGADKITFTAKLDSKTMAKVHHIEVSLFSQSIPPAYLQQRFHDASKGPKKSSEIQRLWYLTSHMNTESLHNGKPFIKNWKLGLGCKGVKMDGTAADCSAPR